MLVGVPWVPSVVPMIGCCIPVGLCPECVVVVAGVQLLGSCVRSVVRYICSIGVWAVHDVYLVPPCGMELGPCPFFYFLVAGRV